MNFTCLESGCKKTPMPGTNYCAEHHPYRPSTEKFPIKQSQNESAARRFETGATRDVDDDKPDYEGYLSPLALERYGEYMLKHQVQSDGTKRDSDNWQKGIPIAQYVKSLIRHVVQLWKAHRGYKFNTLGARDPRNVEEILCAIIFNAQGLLHETIKKRLEGEK